MASYRVLVYNAGSDFGPSTLRAEYSNPLNLAYGSYINDIGECFWTIPQDHEQVNVRTSEGTGHVVVIRNEGGNEDVVWRGVLFEHDATDNDVVFYAYGYESLLHTLHSQWKKKWKNAQIAGASGRPVNDMWNRAQGLTDSKVQWIDDGTLQSPYTTDAQDTNLTLNRYKVNWKPILTIMKELVAIATGETNNICYFIIDYPSDPTDLSATFNFYRDRTSDDLKLRLEYPGLLLDWSDRFTPVLFRNKTLGVGTGPRGQLYRYSKVYTNGPYGRNTFGLAAQNLYLSWVRDRKELKRVVRRRTKLGLREDTNAWVRAYPDTIAPWRSSEATHELGDRIGVKIEKGVTQIDKMMMMAGEQVLWVNGREYVQPMLEDRGGLTSTFNAWTWLTSGFNSNVGELPSGGSFTESVTIPADAVNIAVPVFINELKQTTGGYALITSVTIDGVAGTRVNIASATGGGDRTAMIYYWNTGAAFAGKTVDVVVNHGVSTGRSTLAVVWGVASAGSDIDTPANIDNADRSLAGGDATISLTSGSLTGHAIAGAWHNADGFGPASGTPDALVGPTFIQSDWYSVWGGATATTGAITAGGTGNAIFTVVGSMFSNSE